MQVQEPTTAEADYLVKEAKFIKAMPSVVRGEYEFRMQADVFRKGEPHKPTGLKIMARVKKAPSGIPKPYPSAALEYGGRYRIRGLNYEIWHDNPDTSIVRGWHEHIWSTECRDRAVIRARPKPTDITVKGLFRWGLAKWKIDVGEVKARGHGGKKRK